MLLSVVTPRVAGKPRNNAHRLRAIPNFKGEQYDRNSKTYLDKAEQYATSSHKDENRMSPAIIAYPISGSDGLSDIKSAVTYAKEKNVAIAIRTGGHQYSGASSTYGNNIQLDMSETFKGEVTYSEENGKHLVRASVSWQLSDINNFLGDKGLFVPHGQCCHVHIGGHAHTGGYGQLGRSFGLFGDQIVSLEIIDHNGDLKTVTKDSDADLFYAILGGSPGNFAILTHFTFEVYSNKDYEGSRGLKGLFRYSKKTLNNLLDIMVDMANDKDFPQNYDLCISVVSSSFDLTSIAHYLKKDKKAKEQYVKTFAVDSNKVNDKYVSFLDDTAILHPKTIIVYAQYVPFSKDDKCNESWFDKIIDSGVHLLSPLPFSIPRWFPYQLPIFMRNETKTKPMSQLTKDWIFNSVREYDFPYIKRTYLTNSDKLKENKWAEWVTGRVDEIVSDDVNRCWLSVQIQHFGGNNSKFFQNRNNGTSYSWRDSTLVCVLDCFHEEESKNTAERWQKINDEGVGPDGKFSEVDKRVFWGSYSKAKSNDFDLSVSWPYYYDNENKYNKLRKIKKKVDPDGVFTPNVFSVR